MRVIKNSSIAFLFLVFCAVMNSCVIHGKGGIEYNLGQDVTGEIIKEVKSYPKAEAWGILFSNQKDSVRFLTLFQAEGKNSDDPLSIVLSRSNRYVNVEGYIIPIVFPSDLDFGIDFGSKEAVRVYPFIHGLEIKFVGSGVRPKVIHVSRSG